jgi:Cu(I)/Ag(I) efflux system membrane fusion protein
MKRAPVFGLLSLLAVASPQAVDVVTGVVDPYLRIQTALAADATAGVKENAAAIVAAAAALGEPGASMKQAAGELERAADLRAARAAFWKLSDALLAYAESTKASIGAGNKTAYCPMEDKYWVQKTGPIENPYAGTKMLRCGEFVTSRKK